MKTKPAATIFVAALLPLAIAVAAQGCKGCDKEAEEAQPTVPVPAPQPAPTPVTTIEPVAEDAGADADAPDADAGPKVVGTGDPTGIKKCCQALAQNAKSAPPEQQAGYAAAAAACNGLVNSPQGRQALAGLRSFLVGGGLPAACK